MKPMNEASGCESLAIRCVNLNAMSDRLIGTLFEIWKYRGYFSGRAGAQAVEANQDAREWRDGGTSHHDASYADR